MRVRKHSCTRCDGDRFEPAPGGAVKRCGGCDGKGTVVSCPMCDGHCELTGAWWKCLRCGRTFEEIREHAA